MRHVIPPFLVLFFLRPGMTLLGAPNGGESSLEQRQASLLWIEATRYRSDAGRSRQQQQR
jgi:hypothetical protein